MWHTPAVDRTDLIYFSTGNPGPDYNGTRCGDNLFTASIVAIDAYTGGTVGTFSKSIMIFGTTMLRTP